jgi:hypothetical protein
MKSSFEKFKIQNLKSRPVLAKEFLNLKFLNNKILNWNHLFLFNPVGYYYFRKCFERPISDFHYSKLSDDSRKEYLFSISIEHEDEHLLNLIKDSEMDLFNKRTIRIRSKKRQFYPDRVNVIFGSSVFSNFMSMKYISENFNIKLLSIFIDRFESKADIQLNLVDKIFGFKSFRIFKFVVEYLFEKRIPISLDKYVYRLSFPIPNWREKVEFVLKFGTEHSSIITTPNDFLSTIMKMMQSPNSFLDVYVFDYGVDSNFFFLIDKLIGIGANPKEVRILCTSPIINWLIEKGQIESIQKLISYGFIIIRNGAHFTDRLNILKILDSASID